MQEDFLISILKSTSFSFNNIVEIGCGFGRITKLLAEAFPEAKIVALDLSPHQLEHADKYCVGCDNIEFYQYDIYSEAALPGGKFDLAVAIEVLLHHPTDAVASLVNRLSFLSSWIVNLDPSAESHPVRPARHVWLHDYQSIYRSLGISYVNFPLPVMSDGMKQQIFLASRTFEIDSFQFVPNDQLSDMIQSYYNTVDQQRATFKVRSSEFDWLQRSRSTIHDLQKVVSAGSSFILVDDAKLGAVESLTQRYAMPFVERDGEYWGPPTDDQTAIHELERLRRAGATHLVFAWPAFWWLDYYTAFHAHLRANYPIVRENERIIAFDLRSGG
jgi:SAM-dependent methyltransferase